MKGMVIVLRITWLQFKHSFKVWLLTLLLFVVTGFLVGTCLNAVFAIADYFPSLPKAHNPTDLFLYPLIFGLITVLIVSSGVVKLVINSLSQEYALWTILGANPRQLSGLIGGQMALIAALGSLVGFILSVPVMVPVDQWFVVTLLGSEWTPKIPQIPQSFSLTACVLTVLFTVGVSGLAGYLHAHKLFVSSQDDLLTFKKSRSPFQRVSQALLIVVSAAGVVFCYWNSLSVTPQAQAYLDRHHFYEAGKTYIPNLMLILLLSIILFALIAKAILPWVIQLWTWLLPRKSSATVNDAFWSTVFDKEYLTSLISPLTAGSFMLTGITCIAGEISNGGPNAAAAANTRESVIGFVGVPLSIILANVLTITILTSAQKRAGIRQLSRLGFTRRNLVVEKVQEALIYATTFFICAVLGILPFNLLTDHIVLMTHRTIALSGWSIFTCPLWLWLIMMIFIAVVGSWQAKVVSNRLVDN